MDGEVAAAKKLLEKKKTFPEGLEVLERLVANGACVDAAAAVVEAMKRLRIILICKYSDGVIWDRCMKLFETCEVGLQAEDDKVAMKECKEHLIKARPEPKKEDNPKEAAPAAPRQAPGALPGFSLQDMLGDFGVSSVEDFFQAFQGQFNSNPATRRALHELTLFRVPFNADPGEYTCVVCLEDLAPRSRAKKMPCGHLFHEPCLLEWLEKNNTCPTCRYALPSELKEFAAAADRMNDLYASTETSEPMFS